MDVNIYNKLPFHLAMLQQKLIPRYRRWGKLYAKRQWEQNMGTVLKGVKEEFSPIGRQLFYPNAITQMPLRDVHETRESTEQAVLYRHNYESPYINFLGSFQDFRRKQIPFAMKDLTQQVMTADDMFIRTQVLQYSPYVCISGKPISGVADGFDGDDVIAAPSGIGSNDGSTAKSTAWMQQAAAYVGNERGNLSFKLAKKLGTVLMEDFQAPPHDGIPGEPALNKQVQGKYLVIGSNEAFEFFEFDEYVAGRDKYTIASQDATFSGAISPKINWMSEQYPLRMLADGTFPAPQVYETNPAAWNFGETLPNPIYVNASFEWAFFCGGGAYESLEVGPPPSEFTSGKMSAKKFASLQWNGEVRLTDNILLNIGTAAAPILTTNKYGEFVQLIADTTHGLIPVNRRFVLPCLFRRLRVEA